MTTPGGVPNLPAGALTLDNMASELQDMTPAAMRARAAARVPATYNGSTGGNPAFDASPFGVIAKLFAGFVSHVANADPADITGPEDLPDLLNEFIHDLPVVGEFVRLLDALAGTYVGDDPTLLQIQSLFGGVRGGLDKIREFLESLIGQALDLLHLPAPEQAWRQIMTTFLDPLAWLRNIPVGAISSSTPNLLAEAISNGDGVWTQDAAGAFHVAANGTMRELISDRIALDIDRTINAEVTVKYTGLTAAVGTSPIRLSWIGWNGDDEVAGGDFEIHQPSGPSSAGVTLDGTLKRLAADNWDTVSIRLTVMPGATAGDLVWSGWSATKPDKLPKNLVDGLEDALAAAGQTIRDAICNALGIGGTGHSDADVIHALMNIPQAAVDGIEDFVDDAGDKFKAFFNGWFGRSDGDGSTAQFQQTVEAIKVTVQGGLIMETFPVSNSAWVIPAGVTELYGVTVDAGDNGTRGDVGGPGGGYMRRRIDLTGLTPGTSTLDIAVGAASGTEGGTGGPTTIKDSSGNVLVGALGGDGGVVSDMDLLATTSSAGHGGAAGTALGASPYTATPGEPGTSSGLAAGGTGGTRIQGIGGVGSAKAGKGGDGAAGQTSDVPICGGGGGAGGGGCTSTSVGMSPHGGDGGDGGYPGGGGGAGGQAAGGSSPGSGAFGFGANGFAAALYKLGGV